MKKKKKKRQGWLFLHGCEGGGSHTWVKSKTEGRNLNSFTRCGLRASLEKKKEKKARARLTPIHQCMKRKIPVTAAEKLCKVLDRSRLVEDWGPFFFWIVSHAGPNMTYSHQHMHLHRQLTPRQSLQTESNPNKHWTPLLTVAPGNPISHHDTRHE